MRLCLFAVALLCRPGFAAETDYFPPETKVVIGIQVRSLVDAVVRNFGIDSLKSGASLTASTAFAGFDPTKDLDEVLVATSGKGDNPPALMVLRGRFDVAAMAAKAQGFHGVPILADPQKPDQIMALLDNSTALAGDAALVHAAIDRKAENSNWAARIEPLRAKYAVWGFGDGMEGVPGEAMKSLDRFEFGAALEHGLDLTAAVHFRTAEDAEKLSMFVKMIQAAPQTNGAKLDVQTAEGTIRISLHMPEEELKKAVAAQKDALTSAVMSRLGGKPAATEPKDAKVVTNSQGETTSVTLPGKR